MTNEECAKMLKAKLKCLNRDTSGIDLMCNSRNCDLCELNYEQGNMGEQKEALDIAIKALEQEPKIGHWIDIMVEDMPAQVCDQCKTFYPLSYTGGGHNYCPSCGSRMVESQESEDKE